MGCMGLFSRRLSGFDDFRDRDYVMTGSPLVAQDGKVVVVDASVRLAVRQPADEKDLVLGYDPAEEGAIHAVCILMLRLLAQDVPSDELLVGRSRATEALEQGLAFAPVGAGVTARVLSVELRPQGSDSWKDRHEFRIIGS